jgi:enoyl-CoA hydratase/carnithine racemase
MMLGGRFVDAAKALRIGLVSEVVPAGALEVVGAKMAEEVLAVLLRRPRDSQRKRLKSGLRFCRKALAPSCCSSVLK